MNASPAPTVSATSTSMGGTSKAPALADKKLGARGTARNWNTVLKLAALTA